MSSSIKTSPSKKQQPDIKTEVKKEQDDLDDPSILSDPEDYLEENECLDMNLQRGDQKVWLLKLPKYLMDKWKTPIEGKQLGNIKIRKDERGKLEVKLVLNEDRDLSIPKEYEIKMLNTQVSNSYAFTEENLKKFKQEITEMSEIPNQPELKDDDEDEIIDSRSNKFIPRKKFKYFKVSKDEGGDQVKKYIPFVKTIPKKTALVGKICHDCLIVPSKSDKNYNNITLKRQKQLAGADRPKVTLLDEIPGVIQSNAGPSIKGSGSSVFLTKQPKNKSEGRAIRMPKKDLLDLLFRLFEEYEYWSMKGLKERTRQPESFLKECLDSIANLIKKGPYTSKYILKPEYRKLRDAEKAARLGLVTNDDENDENKENNSDDDDDAEMEDVI
ncbi:unnamed protein product [Candida verbasci]|uniref:Transcription initiation factor IIF subunit beta n=1 Tax=Candida verbasci TaxID=1227364 RepID=A0A9W4TRB3_9ASCO|nr:unnamed protein product [Candida verbasci]